MTVVYEVGKKSKEDSVQTEVAKTAETKVAGANTEPTEAELAKVAEKNKKAELKAKLKALGVEVKGNPGIDKLEAMLAEAENPAPAE